MTITIEDKIAQAVDEAYAEHAGEVAFVLDHEGFAGLPVGTELIDADGDTLSVLDDGEANWISRSGTDYGHLIVSEDAESLYPMQVDLAELGTFAPTPTFQVGDHVRVLPGQADHPYLPADTEGVVVQVGSYSAGLEWVRLRGSAATPYASRFEKFEPAPVQVESFEPLEYPTIRTEEELDALPDFSIVANPENIGGTISVKYKGRFKGFGYLDDTLLPAVDDYRRGNLRFGRPLVVLFAPDITF